MKKYGDITMSKICAAPDCNNIVEHSGKYCASRCRYRHHKQQKYEERKAAGLCRQCGGPMDPPSSSTEKQSKSCAKCQNYFKKRYQSLQKDTLKNTSGNKQTAKKKQIRAGQRFHHLVAISKLPDKVHNEEAWLCKCDCKEETIALKGQLLHGTKKSCGCLRGKTPANALDLEGKTFGLLKVIERAGKSRDGRALWRCQCKCGEKPVVDATSLRSGNTISCGCQRPEQAEYARNKLNEMSVDGVIVPLLTKKVRSDSRTGHKGIHRRIRRGRVYFEPSITVKGKRFFGKTSTSLDEAIKERKRLEEEHHKPYVDAIMPKPIPSNRVKDRRGIEYGWLTVIEFAGFKDKKTLWRCRCKCGEIVDVLGHNLESKMTRSCGCLKWEGMRPDNKSGFKGVTWDKSGRTWVAHIGVNGKRIYLGSSRYKGEAIQLRLEAEKKYHNRSEK
ncbi:AP2 domain-containing protein [Paenibacillus campinasensis]|uniref:AP2/ERF domain-containing protein n=1 Tax=Paenibacillus campinasensis TaxID=66347 RepID=A0A268EIA7_9BACL|nr:AP2 domain-containing protein [Paenibacillus campinasensis]PAD72860.1 hypothetical protein CHH67_21375 [Paenibacillus campinasensis]